MNHDTLHYKLIQAQKSFCSLRVANKTHSYQNNYKELTQINTRSEQGSIIFTARRKEDNAAVILKIMSFGERSRAVVDADLQEAFIMHQLQASSRFQKLHKYIAELSTYFVTDRDAVVLEMPHYTETLDDLWTRNGKTLSVIHIRPIMHQLLHAILLCHSLNVIHGDIKMANIGLQLLPKDQRNARPDAFPYMVKLFDFGRARIAAYSDASYTCADANPLGCKPPEVLLQLPFKQSVDVWAIGILLMLLHADETKKLYNTDGSTNRQLQLERIHVFSGPFDYDFDTDAARKLQIFSPRQPVVDVAEYFPHVHDSACSLLRKMLIANSEHRISARLALLDEFFIGMKNDIY